VVPGVEVGVGCRGAQGDILDNGNCLCVDCVIVTLVSNPTKPYTSHVHILFCDKVYLNNVD
jgi:hypothetical protein